MRFRCDRRASLAALALVISSCTLATDAGERKIDPSLDNRLDFTFKNMSAHPQQPLDVALVRQLADALPGQKRTLVARARIVLPPDVPGSEYPAQQLTMRGVLEEGENELWFYVDSNGDNQIKHDPQNGGEHIWIRKVPETREFVHKAQFELFTEDDYTSNQGDVVLEVDPARVVPWVVADCPAGVEQTLEVEVILSPNAERPSQSGYYKNYGANPLPTSSIRLEGIADAGSEYTVQVLVNGTIVRGLTTKAPAAGDFVVPFADWYPLPLPGTLLEEPSCP